MTTTIPGFKGFDVEGFPMWEPERLDMLRDSYLNAIRSDVGRPTADVVDEALHFLTDRSDPARDGTRYRDEFVKLLVQLADREAARHEILNGRGRAER